MKIDVDKWLGYLSRLLNIIRPKTYNVIARVVIGAGVALVLSQAKILEALVIAAFEFYFGRSDVLREFLNQESNLGWGFLLIAVGLIYHLLMAVGVDLVSVRLQRLPKYPVLTLGVLNADGDEFVGKKIQMRGALCSVPDAKEIPDHVKVFVTPRKRSGFDLMGGSSPISFLNSSINSNFYRERSVFLKTWGGAEMLRFTVANQSSTLAKNVSVSFVVSRVAGVSLDNTNDDLPFPPSAEKDRNYAALLSPRSPSEKYDILKRHTNHEYIFTWDVGDVQAGTVVKSKTLIFLRVDRATEIRMTIYCDDLPEPLTDRYEVVPPTREVFQVATTDLKLEYSEFFDKVDGVSMDGYLRRRAEQEFDKCQRVGQEYLPK